MFAEGDPCGSHYGRCDNRQAMTEDIARYRAFSKEQCKNANAKSGRN